MKEKKINPYKHLFGNITAECSDEPFFPDDVNCPQLNSLGVITMQPSVLLPNELDASAFDIDPRHPEKFQKVDVPVEFGSIEDRVSAVESYINSLKSRLEAPQTDNVES